MLERSVQEVPRDDVGGLADVCRNPLHIRSVVPIQDLLEVTVTNIVEDRLENIPERVVCFRVDSWL